uniref:Uncharacterized protein n=1 Tax=Parastrongyloides trichosuri TaxID=131310 RepID=A0A0N4ZBH4_PARTI
MNVRDRILFNDNNTNNNIKQRLKIEKIISKDFIHRSKYLSRNVNKKKKLKKVKINLSDKLKKRWNNKLFVKTLPSFEVILRRPKRSLSNNEELEKNMPTHLKNIVRLEKYQEMCDYVKAYFERINNENTNVLYRYHNPVKIKTIKENPSKKTTNDIIGNIINIVNNFTLSKEKFSILSPKLFSILPQCKSNKCKESKKILSPNLFSFYAKDGLFSLPSLMENAFDNKVEVYQWLNTLLELSGASKTLEIAITELEPNIKEMENIIYPNILKLEAMEKLNKKIYATFDSKQEIEFDKLGYTFLTPEQLSLKKTNEELLNYEKMIQMSREDHERQLENDIKFLALDENMSQKWSMGNQFLNIRIKRATSISTTNDPLDDYEGHHHSGFFQVFKPSAFLNVVGSPIVFESLALSPHAFISEILNPEFGIVSTLSPRAFIATILSPNALYSRILQPGFFRAEVLSPRALTSWVLSPEFFITEVLSPKFLEAKILSPEIFAIQILSPRIIAPHVVSSENFALLVLSPSILSPSVLGKDHMIVEVLSPHLLGGSHEEDSSENNNESGKKNETLIDNEIKIKNDSLY